MRETGAGLRRLDLLFLADDVGRGAEGNRTVRLALGCAARGHAVRVMTFRDLDGWQWELHDAGIEIICLGIPVDRGWARMIRRAIRVSRKIAPDALIGCGFVPSVAGRIVGAMADVPVVVSDLGAEDPHGFIREVSLQLTDSLATVTVTDGTRGARSLLERRLVSGSALESMRRCVDVGIFDRSRRTRHEARAGMSAPYGRFLWISTCGAGGVHDLATLLSSIEHLRDRTDRPFQLTVVGDDLDIETAHEVVAERGLSAHVRFLGRRDDVPDLLTAADGFVLTSRAEGLPNAVMEAMAARLPVVATSVGGVPELVEDGRTGRLVAPESPLATAGAMLEVMDLDEDDRAKLGDLARAFIEDGYSLDALVDGWESLLIARLERYERVHGVRATTITGAPVG